MNINRTCIERLRRTDRCGYSAHGVWAAEPTALACLALMHSGEHAAAQNFSTQLADVQLSDGAVPTQAEGDSPSWTTSLAILAWLAIDGFEENIDRAIAWTLQAHGKTIPRNSEIGHDTTLLGWSWAANTHAWMEPTCMFVVALKAAGMRDHERTQDGLKLVTDRLLSTGGCNFGSTVVLGQATLPQVQSTGLAMLALAGEVNTDPRVQLSLRYLEENLNPHTTTGSLCYGLIGLTAHNRRPRNADALVQAALERELTREPSAYKLALMALASSPDLSWLPQRPEVAQA